MNCDIDGPTALAALPRACSGTVETAGAAGSFVPFQLGPQVTNSFLEKYVLGFGPTHPLPRLGQLLAGLVDVPELTEQPVPLIERHQHRVGQRPGRLRELAAERSGRCRTSTGLGSAAWRGAGLAAD